MSSILLSIDMICLDIKFLRFSGLSLYVCDRSSYFQDLTAVTEDVKILNFTHSGQNQKYSGLLLAVTASKSWIAHRNNVTGISGIMQRLILLTRKLHAVWVAYTNNSHRWQRWVGISLAYVASVYSVTRVLPISSRLESLDCPRLLSIIIKRHKN
jgi:hypothetical protein